jgi:hypothetical protein
MSTTPIAPLTTLPTLTSGPFAGYPDLNQIYGAPQGNTVPLLDSSTPNLPSLPVQNPGSLTLNPLPSLPSLTGSPASNSSSMSNSTLAGLSNSITSNPILNALASLPGMANSAASNIFGISVGRAATFFLGLILIAGGIFLFRGTQQVVVQTVGLAKKGAKAAGAIAVT